MKNKFIDPLRCAKCGLLFKDLKNIKVETWYTGTWFNVHKKCNDRGKRK